MNLAHAKTRARLQAKARRLAAQDPSAGIELIQHFPLPDFRGAIIGGFWPLPDEIDVRPLMTAMQQMGCPLALPCTARKGHPLTFRQWSPGDTLKAGPFGTKEPKAEKPVVSPNVVLVPLLAFTKRGDRLGYGGGFYDRTLAALRNKASVFTCGVAYGAQQAISLPREPHDVPLSSILTEEYYKVF
jgi:5-formyltetrahydrofolate cyclo-ligase